MYFTESKSSYVNSVLHYLQKSNNIQRDEDGNLNSPFNEFNILEMIKDFVGKDKVSNDNLQDYKYLIRTANIPVWMIKNKSLINQLQDVYKIKKGAGKLCSQKRKDSYPNMTWVPY